MPEPQPSPPALPNALLDAALEVWSESGRQHTIPIEGGSMLPFLRAGDQAVVVHGYAALKRGNVFVFRQQGKLIVHRLIRVEQQAHGPIFIAKGDNVPHFDLPVEASQVLGPVVSVQRNGKTLRLNTWLWRLTGWLIAVGTLGWLMLYGWARQIKVKFLGSAPNRATSFLRQMVYRLASFSRQVVQSLFFHWK